MYALFTNRLQRYKKKMTYTRVYGTFSLFYFDLRVLGKFFCTAFIIQVHTLTSKSTPRYAKLALFNFTCTFSEVKVNLF